MTPNAMYILAWTCVAATAATLVDAIRRRIRLAQDQLDGELSMQGNTSLVVESVRFVKQCLLAFALTEAISGRVKVIIIIVCSLMALTSVYALRHNVKMIRALRAAKQ